MAKRNRERAKQAKRKAKEERKAQRDADKLSRPTELDEFGNPIEVNDDLDQDTEPEADDASDAQDAPPENQ